MIKKFFVSCVKQFIPLLVLLTVICGLVYWSVQQEIRMQANDPQIQIAEDTVSQLNSNKPISSSHDVNISQSLAPFIILYDEQGNEKSSQATLDGKTPKLPNGVLSETQKLGENRLTWQPKNGVRIATIILPYDHGFVLAGRNLREIEKREDQLINEVILSWSFGLITTAIAVISTQLLKTKTTKT